MQAFIRGQSTAAKVVRTILLATSILLNPGAVNYVLAATNESILAKVEVPQNDTVKSTLLRNEVCELRCGNESTEWNGTSFKQFSNVTNANPTTGNVTDVLSNTGSGLSDLNSCSFTEGGCVNVAGKCGQARQAQARNGRQFTTIAIVGQKSIGVSIKKFNTDTDTVGLDVKNLVGKKMAAYGVSTSSWKGTYNGIVQRDDAFFALRTNNAVGWAALNGSFPRHVFHNKFAVIPHLSLATPMVSIYTFREAVQQHGTALSTQLPLKWVAVDPLVKTICANRGTGDCPFFCPPNVKCDHCKQLHMWTDATDPTLVEIRSFHTFCVFDHANVSAKSRLATEQISELLPKLGLPDCPNGIDSVFRDDVYSESDLRTLESKWMNAWFTIATVACGLYDNGAKVSWIFDCISIDKVFETEEEWMRAVEIIRKKHNLEEVDKETPPRKKRRIEAE